MADYLINGEILDNLGNAIREKNGISKYKLLDILPSGYNNIDTGSFRIPNKAIPQIQDDTTIYIKIEAWNNGAQKGNNFKFDIRDDNWSTIYMSPSSMKYYQDKVYTIQDAALNQALRNGTARLLGTTAMSFQSSTNDTIHIYTDIPLEEINPDNVYTPAEMAGMINNMPVIPSENFVFEGILNYLFAYNNYNWLLNLYKDKIKFRGVTEVGYMFRYAKLAELDLSGWDVRDFGNFEGMFIDLLSTNTIKLSGWEAQPNKTYSLSQMFRNCSELKNIIDFPQITAANIRGMFDGCYKLKEFDFSRINMVQRFDTDISQLFYDCRSLKNIDLSTLKTTNSTSSYTNIYNSMFSGCYSLGEITNLPPTYIGTKYAGNIYSYAFDNCFRLKRLTFRMRNDGDAQSGNYSDSVIDLSKNVGYANSASDILNQENGLTADTQITSETYEALKDNPDSWTTDIAYSRYNHDSAVETINTLHNCQSYGSNTIKFNGASGSATDGGAINTLTEEEIAVATAKGWTVALV